MGFEEGPSMQLFAVGIGGVLYDPKWFPEELFNETVIRDTCLLADDLWLKTMEAAAGIPVVRYSGGELIHVIPGSQETALFADNLKQSRNDEILDAIRQWAETYYGRDVLAEQLRNTKWPRITGEDALLDFFNDDKQRTLISANSSVAKLRDYLEKKENRILKLENDISLIRASASYKLGNKMLAPLNRLRKRKD